MVSRPKSPRPVLWQLHPHKAFFLGYNAALPVTPAFTSSRFKPICFAKWPGELWACWEFSFYHGPRAICCSLCGTMSCNVSMSSIHTWSFPLTIIPLLLMHSQCYFFPGWSETITRAFSVIPKTFPKSSLIIPQKHLTQRGETSICHQPNDEGGWENTTHISSDLQLRTFIGSKF